MCEDVSSPGMLSRMLLGSPSCLLQKGMNKVRNQQPFIGGYNTAGQSISILTNKAMNNSKTNSRTISPRHEVCLTKPSTLPDYRRVPVKKHIIFCILATPSTVYSPAHLSIFASMFTSSRFQRKGLAWASSIVYCLKRQESLRAAPLSWCWVCLPESAQLLLSAPLFWPAICVEEGRPLLWLPKAPPRAPKPALAPASSGSEIPSVVGLAHPTHAYLLRA